MLSAVIVEYLVELVVSDIFVDFRESVSDNFLLQVPCVRGYADSSFDVDF